jgi:tripartite-type tricarboxylate transporter receptor subunit TctC
MKSKSTSDLSMIMRAGGGVTVSAQQYSTSDLCMIARAAEAGALLVVTESDSKSTSDLCMIARAKPGQVIFE